MKTTEGNDAHDYSGCMLGVFAGHLLTDELMDEIKETMDKMETSNILKDASENNISYMKSRTGLWLRCDDSNDVFQFKEVIYEDGESKILGANGKKYSSCTPYEPKEGDFVYIRMCESCGGESWLYVKAESEFKTTHHYAISKNLVAGEGGICNDDLIAYIRPATEEEKKTLIRTVEEKYHKTYNEDTKKWEEIDEKTPTILVNKCLFPVDTLINLYGRKKKPANVLRFKWLSDEIAELYEKKNKDYGNSFSDTYKELGEVSVITRMRDKMNRVVQLSKSEAQVKDESKIDTLKDLAAYALMYVMELEGNGTNGIGK